MKLALLSPRSHVFGILGSRWAMCAFLFMVVCLVTPERGDWATAAEGDNKSADQVKDDGVLHLVLEQYEEACNAARSSKTTEEERLRFYSDWRERITEAMKANPKSRYIGAGTVKLLGIANSLGDSQTAEQLAKQLAAESKNPRERLLWNSEMGEVANARYQVTKDKADADRAIAFFTKAAEDYREIAKGKEEPADRNRNITNLCMMAVLYSRALRNHGEAARVFEEVRESLASVPPSNELAALRYDFEYAASSEMMEWLAATDPNRAERALDSLAGRTGMRWPPSYYAHMFVSNLYPQGGKDFQAFIDKWLAQKRQDEWTPFLRFYLAKDYFAHKEYAAARPIFSDLKDKYADVFLKADQEAIRIGRGGFYSEILYCLSVIYRELGDQSQAKAMAGEMKAVVPKDQRVGDLERAATASRSNGDGRAGDGRPLPQSAFRRVALVVANTLLVVLIAIFIWRRLRRRSQ